MAICTCHFTPLNLFLGEKADVSVSCLKDKQATRCRVPRLMLLFTRRVPYPQLSAPHKSHAPAIRAWQFEGLAQLMPRMSTSSPKSQSFGKQKLPWDIRRTPARPSEWKWGCSAWRTVRSLVLVHSSISGADQTAVQIGSMLHSNLWCTSQRNRHLRYLCYAAQTRWNAPCLEISQGEAFISHEDSKQTSNLLTCRRQTLLLKYDAIRFDLHYLQNRFLHLMQSKSLCNYQAGVIVVTGQSHWSHQALTRRPCARGQNARGFHKRLW